MDLITSLQNPRVKQTIKLRDRRERRRQELFLIDGVREIGRAIDGRIELVELFVCEELCRDEFSARLLRRVETLGTTQWHVTPAVFERLAFGQRAEGIVAVAKARRTTLDEIALPDCPLVAVLEGVEKPGNVGAAIRSADGAGVSALVVADAATDLYNPNSIRASLGTIFTLPICAASAAEARNWLAARRITIFTARVDADILYTDADLSGPAAIVLGSESGGLSTTWSGEGVIPIRLPMRGAADSLNVSAAAAVLFYEAMRQRGGK